MRKLAWSLFLPVSLLAQEPPDPWQRMSEWDRNGDGKVDRQEFRGPPQLFERLDADRDGVVTLSEAREMRGRLGMRQRGEFGPESNGPSGFMPQVDQNNDQKISLSEWTEFFKKADRNRDNILQSDEWPSTSRQPSTKDNAPAAGSMAPKVSAKCLDSGREIDLSNVKRATVLVFGSHT